MKRVKLFPGNTTQHKYYRHNHKLLKLLGCDLIGNIWNAKKTASNLHALR